MTTDLTLVIGTLAVLVVLAFLLKVKWNFKGPPHAPPQDNPAPQFHASSAPPPLANKAPLSSALTRRERDILRLVAQNMTNEEIAHELEISRRTVEKHLENVYRKTGARSRAELLRLPIDD